MIKQSIRFLADKSADAALDGKEFSPRMKRLVILVIKISIGVLILDFLIAGLRYGNLGLKDWYYYAFMAFLLGVCINIIRDDAETSLKEMYQSKNWFVKGSFFLAFVVVSLVGFVVNMLSGIDRVRPGQYEDDSDDPVPWSTSNNDQRMNDFMMDMGNDPPTGWN